MAGYRLMYSETSRNQILKLHPEIKPIVRKRLELLNQEPFKGKRLERELAGLRSLRVKRFRIVYKIDDTAKIIEIHYIGHRRDVYELFAERSGRL